MVTNNNLTEISGETDILSSDGVGRYLGDCGKQLNIKVFESLTSTNTVLRGMAGDGAAEGTCIIAANQTAGKGRIGRSFYSPSGTGIYMSLLIRPDRCSAGEAVKITTMAAVAVCEAIEKLTPETPFIKWVNDIYMRGRKVCGILTEAALSPDNGMLDYAVLGVGINVYPPEGGFPENIVHVAGSVLTEARRDARNLLAAEFLKSFLRLWHTPGNGYADEYRRRSLLIGKSVGVIRPDGTLTARVLGIDDGCRLTVEYPDGKTETLSSGEVSLDISDIRRESENR